MANAWQAHVKKTWTAMKKKNKKVSLADALKQAGKTYKKK